MPTTPELDALVARTRDIPGITEVLRTYGAAHEATRYAVATHATARATMSTSTNFTRR